MKLKCAKNERWRPKPGPNFVEKYEDAGLTVGKTYECLIVTLTSGQANMNQGIISTDVKFLVYEDSGRWELKPTDLFAPLEAE